MLSSAALRPLPEGVDDVELPHGLVIRLHRHELALEVVSQVPDTVRRFGPGGSYVCGHCSRLRYGFVRYCMACEVAFCIDCFDACLDEQKALLQEVRDDERALRVQEAMRLKRQRTLKRQPKTCGQLTPIMHACIEGDHERAKDIVDKDEFLRCLDLEQACDDGLYKGKTPLLIAALHGHRNIVVLLMSRGASIGAIDNNGMTALMHAAFSGHVEVLDELLFAGATVDRVAFCGYTALHLAACKGHAVCCHRLLTAHADPMARTPQGRTPLIIAALNGHLNAAELFLRDSAVDIEAKDHEGYSARDAAIATNRLAIERLISVKLSTMHQQREHELGALCTQMISVGDASPVLTPLL